MLRRIGYVRIFVSDFDRAVGFYTTQLGMPLSFRDDDLGWAQLDTAGAVLALERTDPQSEEGQGLIGRFLGITMMVPDLRDAYETLQTRGVRFTGPPEKMPWGGTITHLYDPDENVLTLLEGE